MQTGKWSEYIDMDFSYSNEVKSNEKRYNMDNINDKITQYKSNNLSLEPRLQEYIKKKNFYIKNNIEFDFDIEREFSITPADISIIKGFMRGNSKVYEKDTHSKILSKNLNIKENKVFPSASFRDKEQKNYGYQKISKEKFTTPDKLRDHKLNLTNIKDFRDLSTSYGSYKNPELEDNSSEYMRFMSKCKINKDVDTCSNASTSKKSYGYRNYDEHNYNYVTPRCGAGDDSSMSRSGISTRIDNRKVTKK